jgi:hypothetical protein
MIVALCDEDLARVSGGAYAQDMNEFLYFIGGGSGIAAGKGNKAPKRPPIVTDPIHIYGNPKPPPPPPPPKRPGGFPCC